MFPKFVRLVAGLVLGPAALAQTAPPPRPAPVSAAAAIQVLNEWRMSRIPKLMNDWGELERYRAANAALPATAGEDRVVFFGDSIVEAWRRTFSPKALRQSRHQRADDIADAGALPRRRD